MFLALAVVVSVLLLAFCIVLTVQLSKVSDKLLLLESVDCQTDNRLIRLKDRLETLNSRIDRYHRDAVNQSPASPTVPRGVEVAKGTYSPMSEQEVAAWRNKIAAPIIQETTPDGSRATYDVDWGKSGVTFKPFSVLNTAKGESQAVTAGFDSKLVTRMDELQPRATSAGEDLHAAEILPGSPAANIGSQANNSRDFLEQMQVRVGPYQCEPLPKVPDALRGIPQEQLDEMSAYAWGIIEDGRKKSKANRGSGGNNSDQTPEFQARSMAMLRMFNASPIICARGAMLVEKKGV